METLWFDIRHGCRALLKAPGLTLVAAGTLTVGIGGNVTLFSIFNAIYLNPLPYETPPSARLYKQCEREKRGASLPDIDDWRTRSSLLEDIGAYWAANINVTGMDRLEGRRGRQWGRALVVGEVTLAFTLLASASVLFEALGELHNKELGFDPENILTMRMTPPETKYEDEDRLNRFYEAVLDRIVALPGVWTAGTTNNLTLTGADMRGPVALEEDRQIDDIPPRNVSIRSISPKYLSTLSVPIVAGRGFDDGDGESAPLVAIVNETWARRWSAEESPLGKRIFVWNDRTREIVGVLRDFYEVRLDRPIEPVIYLPSSQAFGRTRSLTVRFSGEPEAMVSAAQQAIWSIDPEQPVYSVQMMEEWVARQAWVFKRMTASLVIFATIALAMGAVGIYGVTAYGVSQRTSEVGVRMAFGASRRNVMAMILREGVVRTLAGIIIGLPLSFLLIGVLERVLFGVSQAGWETYLSMTLLMTATTLLACYVPADLASRLEPTVALRQE